jgi:hypothetical protein
MKIPIVAIIVVSLVLFSAPPIAYPQVRLTGAIQFATNSSGAFSENQSWNTLGSEPCWNLWVTRNSDASSPINGPSDSQAGINISLDAGSKYQFYTFGAPDLSIRFNGLNLFFDGNGSIPGISVLAATNSSHFRPNYNGGTRTLAGDTVAGSGTTAYRGHNVTAVLTEYIWNAPTASQPDVCQAFSFAPGGGPSFFGSFTLEIFPVAAFHLSQRSGSPGASVTLAGSGFAPAESVLIYSGHLGSSLIAKPVADASGSFSISGRVPPHSNGPVDIFALGQTSARLGVSSFFVTPALATVPSSAKAGDAATAEGFGFGTGEIVSVYWNNPRVLLGTVIANGVGSFAGQNALNFTIPENASPGTEVIIGIGQTTKAVGVGEIKVQ